MMLFQTFITAFLWLDFLYTVDGLDKASIANSDGPTAGSQTPPFKRKGKLSTIGKIFKPWKWRKKKTSDKFRETSAGRNSIILLEDKLLNFPKGKKSYLAGFFFFSGKKLIYIWNEIISFKVKQLRVLICLLFLLTLAF